MLPSSTDPPLLKGKISTARLRVNRRRQSRPPNEFIPSIPRSMPHPLAATSTTPSKGKLLLLVEGRRCSGDGMPLQMRSWSAMVVSWRAGRGRLFVLQLRCFWDAISAWAIVYRLTSLVGIIVAAIDSFLLLLVMDSARSWFTKLQTRGKSIGKKKELLPNGNELGDDAASSATKQRVASE